MASNTENHELNVYSSGEESWTHSPDMETIEERLIVRDDEASRGNYTAHNGAIFVAQDTGAVYDGNGTSWELADRDVDALGVGVAFLGEQANTPTDSDYESDEVALYFKSDGNLYKRVHGGSEEQVGADAQSGTLTDSNSDTSDGGDIYRLPNAEDAIDLRGGGEIQDAETVETVSLLTERSPVFNVTHPEWGATGDGTTDDSAAIQAAIDAAGARTNGGAVYLPEPDTSYRIENPLVVNDNGVVIVGAEGEVPIDATPLTTSQDPIRVEGSPGSEYAIGAVSEGDTTVTTSTAGDASNFADGDIVLVGSADEFPGTSSDKGELSIVASADGSSGEIQLQTSLYDDYTSTPIVQPMNAVHNTQVKNVDIELPGGDTYDGVSLDNAAYTVISNVSVTGAGGTAYSVTDSFDTRIVDSRCADGYFTGSGTSYGVGLFNATTRVVVQNCHFEELRHAVTIGGNVSKGGVKSATVRDCFGSNVAAETTAVYDTHELGQYIAFKNNVAHGSGFQIRCDNVTITGNEVHGGDDGVVIRGTRESAKITNNTFRDQADYGVFLPQDNALVDSEISNNLIQSPGSYAIDITSASQSLSITDNTIVDAGATAIIFRGFGTIPSGVTNELITVKGNTIRGAAGDGVSFSRAYDASLVTNNVIKVTGSATTTGNLTNSVVTDNVEA